jgi:ubiquinone/menaquinone biosynthesis C-methylase UbiE
MRFNFIAPYYDLLSKLIFGTKIEKLKVSFFNRIPANSNVLFIGGGSGTSLQTLLQIRNNVSIDYVEPSSKMIKKAIKRVGGSTNIHFHQLNIEEFEGVDYDVIITEYFFDLFDEFKIYELVEMIGLKLNRNGKWIDTDFRAPNTFKDRLLLKTMYLFFKLTVNLKTNNLVSTNQLFLNAGLEILGENTACEGFSTSRLITQKQK